jgi:predicted nucleic acid-binding protein
MPIYTFDTSVIIAYRVRDLPKHFLLSAVVMAELTASAIDDSTRKVFEAMRRDAARYDALIIPDGDDWLTASRVLHWLSVGRKRKAGGKTPPLLPGASQRMFFDALIAVGARRAGATVVTEDWDDFKAIQYYCPVKLMRGADFFKQ